MKITLYISMLVGLALASPSFANQPIGIYFIDVPTPNQERPLSLSLWYPATGNGTSMNVGGNAVFTGVEAQLDAPIDEKKSSLVLVAHGGLRSAHNSGAWLSESLAKAGNIVVEINGQRPTSAADAVNEIWQRPSDLSRALDAVMNDAKWSKYVDHQHIHAVGFALGGTSVLAMAGGVFEPQAFMQSCDTENVRSPDCAWYSTQNTNLESVNQNELIKSRRDSRISSVVSISPEFIHAFSGKMASVETPSLLLTLTHEPGAVGDTHPEIIAATVIEDATLFDGFDRCTHAGPAILSEDGGDTAICGESFDARLAVHNAITDQIVAFISVTTTEEK